MNLEIKRASRQGVIPWIDLYSESGCGKTMSALLLARGIAGPAGKIVLADSESKRGSLYADVIPGGYDVIDFGEPFSPQTYREVAEAIFKSGAAVGIIDSMSHEWENVGGVLDMAGEAEAKSGKPGLHNWKVPKLEHNKLVQLLLRSPIPLICCIRAKYKTRQGKENGRTVIIKDDFTSPIQSEEFIFEATCHAEVLHDHSIRLTKCSHPDLRKCFPEKGPITVQHGEMIAKWCAAPGGPGAQRPTDSSSLKALKIKLRDVTYPVHGWKTEHGAESWTVKKKALAAFLADECQIDTVIDAMNAQQLTEAIAAAEKKLAVPV